MNGWFPRFNLKGDIVSGYGSIWINGIEVAPLGFRPQWLNNDVVDFMGPNDNPYRYNTFTKKLDKISDKLIQSVAAGFNLHKTLPRILVGTIAISIDKYTGNTVTLEEYNGNNNDHSVFLNGRPLTEHKKIQDIRANDGLIAWSEYTVYPARRNYLYYDNFTYDCTVLKDAWEGSPIPFFIGNLPWLLIQTNLDLRIHPYNSKWGYIIKTGEDKNLNPDIIYLDNEIRVAYQDKNGNLKKEKIPLTQSFVDISLTESVIIPPVDDPPVDDPLPIDEPTMRLSTAVREVRDEYITKFPFPRTDNDDQFRNWFRGLVEQLVYSFPGMKFGRKAQSPAHPISHDTLAQQQNEPNKLLVYDLFINAGASSVTKVDNPEGFIIDGQFFVPTPGHNHLRATPVDDTPVDIPPTTDLKPILDRLTTLEIANRNLEAELKLTNEEIQKLKSTPIVPYDVARKSDVVEVEGSLSFKDVVQGRKVKWLGKIL